MLLNVTGQGIREDHRIINEVVLIEGIRNDTPIGGGTKY